jgi:lysophospholipase L1-like esterase
MNKKTAGSVFILLSALVAISALFSANFFLKDFPLSLNDRHVRWLLFPGRYFTADRGEILKTNPELTALDNGVESFSAVKEPGVFRVFCLGGSTTRGWPFHENFSYPKFLSGYLHAALPGRKIEVINAGFHNSDSSSDVSLVNELSGYQPDLLLIYEGRNEVWNYPFHVGRRNAAIRAHLFLLEHLRLYGLLRKWFSKDGMDHADSFKKWAIATVAWPLEDVESHFKSNLAAMLDIASARGARAVFLTQAVVHGDKDEERSVEPANAWLEQFAAERKADLIDLDAVFKKSASPSIELLFPPPAVHPTLDGYCLMAKVVLDGLKARGLPAPANEWRSSAAQPLAACRAAKNGAPAGVGSGYRRAAAVYEGTGKKKEAKRYRALSAQWKLSARVKKASGRFLTGRQIDPQNSRDKN